MRVLLAGFGPFPGAPLNPSAAVAQALARRRRPALADLDRSVHVFATTYAAVDRDLPKLFVDKPDIVLIFGLAGRRHQMCIETRARNALSLLVPDASGRRQSTGVIEAGGPDALFGRAPFQRLLSAAAADAKFRPGYRAMPGAICAITFIGAPCDGRRAARRSYSSSIFHLLRGVRGQPAAAKNRTLRRWRTSSLPPKTC